MVREVRTRYGTVVKGLVATSLAALVFLAGVSLGMGGFVYAAKHVCKSTNAEALVYFYHYSCRATAISPFIAKKAVEEELNIPVLMLEGDSFDTRDYSAEALRTRVEAFAEMLRMRKAAKVS